MTPDGVTIDANDSGALGMQTMHKKRQKQQSTFDNNSKMNQKINT